jgi:hypothetical protein
VTCSALDDGVDELTESFSVALLGGSSPQFNGAVDESRRQSTFTVNYSGFPCVAPALLALARTALSLLALARTALYLLALAHTALYLPTPPFTNSHG